MFEAYTQTPTISLLLDATFYKTDTKSYAYKGTYRESASSTYIRDAMHHADDIPYGEFKMRGAVKRQRIWCVFTLPILILLLSTHSTDAQGLFTTNMTFEIAGENVGAGVELADPKAILLMDSQVLIADEGLQQIIVVNDQTGIQSKFGRAGAGPGEFHTFAGLSQLSSNRVAVLDHFNMRISILELASQELSLVSTIPLKFIPGAMCSISDRLIVSGWFDGKFLHELDDSGQIIHSFGEHFRSEAEFHELSVGIRSLLIGIDQTTATMPSVIVASVEFGMIRAYRADRGLLWDITPPGFRPIEVAPTSRGGISFRTPREGLCWNLSKSQPTCF